MVDGLTLSPSAVNDWARAFHFVAKYKPWVNDRLKDASTISQVQSKTWMISELSKLNLQTNNVALLGGWFAHIVTPLLLEKLKAGRVTNYEIDRDAKKISYKFNNRYIKQNRYFAVEKNVMLNKIYDDNRLERRFDLVINTSCEHMFPMKRFLNLNSKMNCVYALQSTDLDTYDDHINCVASEQELVDQSGLNQIYFQGSRKLDNGMTRFMVIGK